ncbi:MAG: acyl carrier protein [Spirochaetota bacterium]|nr:acyl carrier protein [Spirochaetota bacterium]
MSLKKEIAEIVFEELKLENVTHETFNGDMDLIEELGVDSMELTTIAVKLQDKYSVKIEEEDYANITTLNKIISYIDQKVN